MGLFSKRESKIYANIGFAGAYTSEGRKRIMSDANIGIAVLNDSGKYLKRLGGIKVMQEMNERKAAKLYAAIDASEMFKGTVAVEDRSLMNVTFVTGDADLDKKFIAEAKEEGLINLAGHRSVGGMRASIYNAMPEEGVDALIEFIKKFEAENK